MFRDPTIAGSWPVLIDRLETGAAVVRWAAQEPALSGVRAIADFPDLLAAGGDRQSPPPMEVTTAMQCCFWCTCSATA
jgi:hypothetical protein